MSRRPPRLIVLLLVLIAASLGMWYGVFSRPSVEQDVFAAGTVEATEIQVGFQTAGRIDSVYVREGDRVEEGMTLAALDRSEITARRRQAEAQVAASRAALQELERGFRSEEIAQARAVRDAARQRAIDAERDLDRTRHLFEGGALSRELYDKTQTAFAIAQSQLTQAEEQVKLLEKGPRKERVEAQAAQVGQAEAALAVIDATLENMKLVARRRGVVTGRHREAQEITAPGAPVLTIMNPDDRWVRIFIREDRIGAVHLGQTATITADTYPEKIYRGEVRFIASEAEFTPKNVQTAEERVKLVFAVKVCILDDADYDLKPGMPADVRLE